VFGGGDRLGGRGWAADAHAAEAALCVVRGVDQRPQGKEEQEDRRYK